ncbi:hypothetical protein JIG36_39555 [Actinoplanes sp. LDG1-06]|uniref:Uncharacterized protein n=1 Tax=Paractinoplanes ovalisporus TaxID=2810368 RepID=A0ABS2APB7_9ACTN|nr:hypothetical protein [Actinoplanes ovalisporus]MBM2621618.1 hypothetical protein [Actinoplanes ovalisporus]
MQPYPPRRPEPEPSFLEREFIGIPIFVHIAATAVSCGIWPLALLIVYPISAVKSRIDRAVDRVVDPIVDRLFAAVLRIVSWPFRFLYHRYLKDDRPNRP